jgi:fimbrial chaperone protein
MRRLRVLLLPAAVAALGFFSQPSFATSFEITPVGLDVTAPASAATLTLSNRATTPVTVQVRVFKWVAANGDEALEPTEAVVASPPMTTIPSAADYTIRVVRVSKEPVTAVEFYRVLVDEVPPASTSLTRSVALVVRYSLPAIFYASDATPAALTWTFERRNGRMFIAATNSGDTQARIAGLKLENAKGTVVSFGEGLVGYVLGHSKRIWPLPAKTRLPKDKSALLIVAQTNYGPIRVAPRPSQGR